MLESLNKTELIEIIKKQTGRRISRSLTAEELLGMINGNDLVGFSKTEKTRKKLELFIDKNWDAYQTNLPCRGEVNEGKCTIYKCPEGRHIDCFMNVKGQMK